MLAGLMLIQTWININPDINPASSARAAIDHALANHDRQRTVPDRGTLCQWTPNPVVTSCLPCWRWAGYRTVDLG